MNGRTPIVAFAQASAKRPEKRKQDESRLPLTPPSATRQPISISVQPCLFQACAAAARPMLPDLGTPL